MRLCFALVASALLLAAPAAAQITYDGTITEDEWFEIGDDLLTPSNGFGPGNQLNAFYADIADDGSSISLGLAGSLDGNDIVGNRNYIVVLLDTRAGGYGNGDFGRADGPDFGTGITNFNSGSNFDTGFEADYALQIGCSLSDCFSSLYTLSGSAGSGGGPSTFIGSASGSTEFGENRDPADPDSETRGFEIRLTASGDGSEALLQLDDQSFQAFAFIISGSGFLSNQFITPVGEFSSAGGGNYGFDAIDFDLEDTNPVVYVERVFADQRTRPFRDRGYRMLASPTFFRVVQDLGTQDLVRFRGSGEAVEVLTDYNGTAFVPAPSAFTGLTPGFGYMWYLYDGRTPDSQGPSDPQSRALPYVFEEGGEMASTDEISAFHTSTDPDPTNGLPAR